MKAEVSVGKLYLNDVTECARIEAEVFVGESPWSESALRQEISALSNSYFAARLDGKLVGFAGISLVGSTGDWEAEVHTVAVDPNVHRLGIGQKLLTALLSHADKYEASVFLEVRTTNIPAITLYKNNGFEQLSVRKNYYQPSGDDAFVLRRPAAEGAAQRKGENQ